MTGQARRLARQGQWQALWLLILSQPLPQAASAAAHLKLHRWSPRSDADARLADILVGIDHREAVRLGKGLFGRTSRILPYHLSFADAVGFSVRHPVVALDLRGLDRHTSRVATVDRTGVRSTLYEGPARHWSLCALDSETVIARRQFGRGGYRGDTEIVRYDPGGETVLASGTGLLDAVVEATATGFVMGLKLGGVAVALADGEQETLDLREFGLHSSALFAVDATGTRIAFVEGNRMVITDSRLQPLYDLVVESLLHPDFFFNAVTFTGDSIVTYADAQGLYRWQVIGGRIRGLHPAPSPSERAFFRLNPVAPWNLLVAGGGNVNVHYDMTTLARCPTPDFLVPAGSDENGEPLRIPGGRSAVGRFAASAYGRLAVYDSGLAIPITERDFSSTVVQDLEHPLNVLVKPVAALDAADADRVRPHLGPSSGTADTYSLTATERAVLEAAVRACEWAPRAEGR